MANNSSIADHLTDWQRLDRSVTATTPEELPPGVTGLQGGLQITIIDTTQILASQDSHRAGLRGDTKLLRELLVRGQDLARQIRSMIRGHLGPRNEKLGEYRIHVLGRPRGLPPSPPPEPLPEDVKPAAAETKP